MITRVFGKKIEKIYDVDHKWIQIKGDDGDFKTVYTDKPTLTRETKVKEWSKLCAYEGEPRYNSQRSSWLGTDFGASLFGSFNQINISENETVVIEEEIFRADLNEMHLHTNKIVEEIDVDKEDALSILEGQIKAFNKMMIESNNRLMAYCDLHKLSYEDTDCIELFNLVFPDDEYVIEDGIMKVKGKPKTTASSLYIDGSIATTVSIDTSILNTLNTISTK